MNFVKRYAKALVLLVLIIVAAVAQWLGVDVGLDMEHYIALLAADVLVWAVPNQEPSEVK